MRNVEEVFARVVGWLFRRDAPAGHRIMVVGLCLGFLCWLPLLLYIVFGPRDGNPIGLGLLAMLGMPIAIIGASIGVIVHVFESRSRRAR